MAHKMNTLIILDVVVKLIDETYRRMTMLISYDPTIKPKALGKDMLSFFLTEYTNKEEYKGTNIYEKVLGKPFTEYITNKINELLIVHDFRGKYTELTVLAVKELDHINDMIISDIPFKVPTSKEETTIKTEDK